MLTVGDIALSTSRWLTLIATPWTGAREAGHGGAINPRRRAKQPGYMGALHEK